MARIDLSGDNPLAAYQKVCTKLGRTMGEAAIAANLDPETMDDILNGSDQLTGEQSDLIKTVLVNWISREYAKLDNLKTQLINLNIGIR